MICNNCGSQLSDAANFCNTCGMAIKGNTPHSYGNQAGNQPPVNPVSALWSDAPPPAPVSSPSVVCKLHTTVVAAGTCVGCGNFYCRGCIVSAQGRNYCQGCYAHYYRTPLQPPPYSSPSPPPPAGQPYYYSQPPQPVRYPQPALQPPQPYSYPQPAQLYVRRKEPGVALLLSFFMPGLGQIYNGDVGKGIIFFISFWILVWVFIGWIIWIWALVDAHQSATNINMGRRV